MILSNYMLSQISCSDLSGFGLEIDMINDYLHLVWFRTLLRFSFCVLLQRLIWKNKYVSTKLDLHMYKYIVMHAALTGIGIASMNL